MEDQPMRIEDVEGIGEDMGGKLRAVGVATTDDLLMAGASPSGREKVAGTTGISEKLLLKWVNHVDLMRIPGVGSEYSDLLEAAGVDSPAELVQRNAANLAQTFQELDAARPNTVRRVPSQAVVEDWIAAARSLEGAVSH
jgi:predicted flap endonuclease-1-like 5' DNA nuclease